MPAPGFTLRKFEQAVSKQGNQICGATGMTAPCCPQRAAPMLYWQAIVAHNLVVLQERLGSCNCVAVQLPAQQCEEAMYWQASADTPLCV